MDRSMECPKCGENFYDIIRVPKQLNCLHNVCLQCLNEMHTADNKIRCPVCGHSQRVAIGSCDMLPNDVILCRRLANMRIYCSSTPEGETGYKEILQTRINALRVEIHSWEQQLRGYSQERARVDALANRAKERIQDAVERLVDKLRARGLQLCSRVNADVEPYKSEPFARIQEQIRSGVDVCRKAEDIMREFEMRAHESEECVEVIRSLLAGADMTLLERLDVELSDDNMDEAIATFGKVTAQGILQRELNVGDSALSAPDIPSAPSSAPPMDYTHFSGPTTIDPESASATESADGNPERITPPAASELPLPSAPLIDPPPAWELCVDGDPPGRGAARCNGLCMPPCYECVMSSSRYADAWTHAQGSPAQTGSAQLRPGEAGTAPAQLSPAAAPGSPGPSGTQWRQDALTSAPCAASAQDYGMLSIFAVQSGDVDPAGLTGELAQSVALHSSQLVVANPNQGRVQVLDLHGRMMRTRCYLGQPRGVAVDRDANLIYVTDQSTRAVHALDFWTLDVKGTYGRDGRFNSPNQVAVDAKYKILYVTDSTDVVVMTLRGFGKVIGMLSGITHVARRPWGVAVGDKVVAVTYAMDRCVVVYQKIDGVASAPGRVLAGYFPDPRGVCIDNVGNILVADQGVVKVMSSTSSSIIAKVEEQLIKPLAVTAFRDKVIVADDGDGRIKVYQAATHMGLPST